MPGDPVEQNTAAQRWVIVASAGHSEASLEEAAVCPGLAVQADTAAADAKTKQAAAADKQICLNTCIGLGCFLNNFVGLGICNTCVNLHNVGKAKTNVRQQHDHRFEVPYRAHRLICPGTSRYE